MRLTAQFVGCIAALAGTFAALILVAGSRDAQMIAGLLVVVAVLLSVPLARRWIRRVRRDGARTMLRDAREALTLPEDAPHTPTADPASSDRPAASRSRR